MRLVVTFIVAAFTSPGWAAEPAHCYRTPPQDALPGKTPSPFSFIDYTFGPTMAWRVCEYDITRHAEIWRAFYASHGCKKRSDVGQMIEQLIDAPLEKMRGVDELERAKREVPKLFTQWCAAWREFQMPRYDQFGIEGEHDGSADALRTRFLVLEETDKIARQIGKKLGLR